MLYAAEDSETPKYTEEQLQKLKAAEEKYKDNPQIMNMINKLKENSGITDADVEDLRQAGYPDDAIFELTIIGSTGAALVGLEQIYAALYDPSPGVRRDAPVE